jgi:transcriptional regulator with XRE-family HTH domain
MIRETIIEALLARKMTRVELARQAGCRVNTITDFLNNKSEMRTDLLTKVFEILNIKTEMQDM